MVNQTDQTETFVRVFGAIGIDVDGEPLSIGGVRQRRLLALLAARAGVVVSVDWLAEHLWDDGDRPEAPAPALRTYLSRLRQALPEQARAWIETESSGYRFAAPAAQVEHLRFAELRSEARVAREGNDVDVASALLDEALGLWRGDAFREIEHLDWVRPLIEQLHLDRLELLEERWEVALAQGRHTQITGELAAFTAEHGLRDRAARQYALALHRSGRTAEALRVIENHRSTLAEESGLEPSAGIVELEQALLTSDPALIAATAPAGAQALRGYELLDEIGSGAFSVVWRAVQPSVDREVAIKQIRSELATQPDFIRRFEAEAHLVARIEHPHVVPLIDFWREPDSAYLVMRWLRGGTLERRLDDGPLSLDETLKLARQMCGALAAAHRHGVVHRDVKSGNIFFDDTGNAFLGDFGIALEAAQSAGPDAALSTGSPAYSSPEQLRREQLGPQADVFSLGVVLFECLAGTLPFHDSASVTQLVDRQLNTDYPPLIESLPHVPAHVSDAIAKATAKDSADRFGSMEAFLAALESGEPASDESPALVALDADVENPYKGLRAFDDGDSDRFFGREILTDQLIARLSGNGVQSRCLVLVGPSGSGKSSVVKAGLAPAIRDGQVPGSQDWFVTTMVPGPDPYEALEAALLRVAVNPPDSLLTQLGDGKRGILRCLRRCLHSDDDTVVIIIDQLEEIFTSTAPEVAHSFLEALAVAVEDATSPLRLVATLRADYFDRPLAHPTFAAILNKTAVNITPLTPDQLERAIVEPARRVGAEFEPGLTARIAAETIGQTSSLPLLQYTLAELFDRRDGNQLTLTAYDAIGGLAGALAARAEDIYTNADTSQESAIRRVFGRMTNPGQESADLRRRVPLADIGDNPADKWAIEQYGNARLITFDRNDATREPTVEVAHEALLREWPRLVAWLGEDGEILRTADTIAAAAANWDKSGRPATDLYRGGRLENALGLSLAAPDRLRPIDTDFITASQQVAEDERETDHKRVRRLRRLVTATAAGLVIALIAGGLALRSQQQANSAADEADQQRAVAEAQSEAAVASAEEAALAAQDADQQRGVAEAQSEAAVASAEEAAAATEDAELATLISRSAEIAANDEELAILLALEAHRRAPGPSTEQAVLNALGSSTLASRVSDFLLPDICSPYIHPSRGSVVTFVSTEDVLMTVDTLTNEVTEHGPPPAPCVNWAGDAETGRRFAFSPDGLRMWFGSWDGPWEVERELSEPMSYRSLQGFNTAHRIFLMTPETNTAFVVDDRTGETVGELITGSGEVTRATMSPTGEHGLAAFKTPADNGEVVIVDGATGSELFRIETDSVAIHWAFDEIANEVVVGTADGSLTTIDLATGESVARVRTSASSRLLHVGLRDDGLLVVISTDLVEVVDRRLGPTGDTTKIRDTVFAVLRPDGRFFLAPPRDVPSIFDLGASALTDTVIQLEGNPTTGFQPPDGSRGRVLITDPETAEMELLDLSTGDSESLPPLTTPEGDPFEAAFVRVEDTSVLAVSVDGQVARWEDGIMTERITTGPDGVNQFRGISGASFVVKLPDGSMEIHVFDPRPGKLAIVTTVATSSVIGPASRDSELHVLVADGTLTTYDDTGAIVRAFDTGFANALEGAAVAQSGGPDGLIAFGGTAGAFTFNPATEEITPVATLGRVSTLGFARDGALLLIGDRDGVVRVWDVDEQVSRGTLLRSSASIYLGGWYDPEADALWIRTGTQLLRLPLNPEVFLERACEVVNRDLTQQEWDTYIPGGGDVQSSCST